jgi:hypothetical protein
MQGAEMAAYPVPALEPATETPVREKAWDRPKRDDGWGVLAPRSGPGFGVLEGVALFAYGLLLAWVIPHHEAWFDEAQAWLIARDSSLVDLVAHRLHYEGAPAFWHLMLWVEVRLGVSFLGMHLIAGAVAVAGMYVWLRYSRLPRAVNLLTPFTFYVVFQYAVVARDYVLAPLLIFVLTALYSNRRSSPWVFALVAGVLANCSLHMASVATGIAILYGVDRVRHREGRSVSFLVGPTLVLVGLLAASAATAVPTMDGSSTTANPLVQTIRKMVSGKPSEAPAVSPNKASTEFTDGAATTPPEQGRLATRMWWAIHGGAHPDSRGLLRGRVLKHAVVLLTAITAPISTSNLLAFGFLLLLCANLARAKMWLALLPYCLLQVCNTMVAGEAHHIGLTWITLLAVMWMLALRAPKGTMDLGLRSALYACVIVIQVLQIGWGAHALAADLKGPYSSAPATAAFLQTLPVNERVAAFDDDSDTVNAYLTRLPYFNQRTSYWPFSRTKDPSLFVKQTMDERPDMVIVKMTESISPVMDQWVKLVPAGTEFVEQDMAQMLHSRGYRETHRFCGSRFYRNTSESLDCRLVYERSPGEEPVH